MPSPTVERIIAVIVADLRRQEAITGCAVDHHGTRAQVDGSFDLAPIAVAILRELSEAGGD